MNCLRRIQTVPYYCTYFVFFFLTFGLEMRRTYRMNDHQRQCLITLVKSYSLLYDKQNRQYSNTRAKMIIWRQIGAELGVTGKFLSLFIFTLLSFIINNIPDMRFVKD